MRDAPASGVRRDYDGRAVGRVTRRGISGFVRAFVHRGNAGDRRPPVDLPVGEDVLGAEDTVADQERAGDQQGQRDPGPGTPPRTPPAHQLAPDHGLIPVPA